MQPSILPIGAKWACCLPPCMHPILELGTEQAYALPPCLYPLWRAGTERPFRQPLWHVHHCTWHQIGTISADHSSQPVPVRSAISFPCCALGPNQGLCSDPTVKAGAQAAKCGICAGTTTAGCREKRNHLDMARRPLTRRAWPAPAKSYSCAVPIPPFAHSEQHRALA